ncbi:MAG: YceI family protein [Myxococcales bacterium]|nr:YceI family protein [Myxococcales bacterium]
MTTSRTTLGLVLGLTLSFSVACEDPTRDKPKAGAAAPVATAAAAPAADTQTLSFSASGSKIEFVGAKVTGKHDGSFGQFTGNVKLVSGDPTKSQVSVEIDAASISSDNPKLTGHLKSPDFFDVEKFPKARFESTSIKAGGDKGATHTVTGNLELHGEKKSITFPATIKTENGSTSVDAEFSINRKDFGLNYPGKVDDLIRDDVLIKLTIRASAKPS